MVGVGNIWIFYLLNCLWELMWNLPFTIFPHPLASLWKQCCHILHIWHEKIWGLYERSWTAGNENKNEVKWGAPWWLNWLSFWLWLRSWSLSSWVPALRQTLCWQFRAWRQLQILCLPLSLSLCSSPIHALSLSVSQKWINFKKKKVCIVMWPFIQRTCS